jgi:hypothetical protein
LQARNRPTPAAIPFEIRVQVEPFVEAVRRRDP